MPLREPPAQSKVGRPLATLAAIAAIVSAVILVFAWVGGWLAPGRLTPQDMTDAIQTANGKVYPGYRRAHAKGVCVSGYFEGNGEGQALSKAGMFKSGRSPLLGRMSIGGGAPHGMDGSARVRSMALKIVDEDGHEWRMAMNSFPFFAVSSVQAFYEQSVASAPDPATGKPDPAKMAAFTEAHPESANFARWAKSAPWSTSFANTRYNGVNTFRFEDAGGRRLPRRRPGPAAGRGAAALGHGGDRRWPGRLDYGPLAGLAGKRAAGNRGHGRHRALRAAGHRSLPRCEFRPADPAAWR